MNELLDFAPCGFLSFSSDGTILVVNQTLAGWLASEPEGLKGQSIKSILSVGARIFYETHFWPQLKMQGEIEEIYFPLLTSSGASLPILANAARREREGNTTYDCIFVRMNQRDKYERELLLARKEAEQANQAKADFLSLMSHELRTPLNAILGFTEIINSEMHGPVTPQQQEDLKYIEQGGENLLHLLEDILNFVDFDKENVEIKLDRVDVGDATSRATALVMPQLKEAGIHYKSQSCNSDVKVNADPNRYQQIIVSLLANAIKFTPRGGSIMMSCVPLSNHVFIQIGDTGRGIPSDQLTRIFEPFVQIDPLPANTGQRGLGLGLAICCKMARAMGGDLTVSSVEGVGSVFTLSLPRYQTPDLIAKRGTNLPE